MTKKPVKIIIAVVLVVLQLAFVGVLIPQGKNFNENAIGNGTEFTFKLDSFEIFESYYYDDYSMFSPDNYSEDEEYEFCVSAYPKAKHSDDLASGYGSGVYSVAIDDDGYAYINETSRKAASEFIVRDDFYNIIFDESQVDMTKLMSILNCTTDDFSYSGISYGTDDFDSITLFRDDYRLDFDVGDILEHVGDDDFSYAELGEKLDNSLKGDGDEAEADEDVEGFDIVVKAVLYRGNFVGTDIIVDGQSVMK